MWSFASASKDKELIHYVENNMSSIIGQASIEEFKKQLDSKLEKKVHEILLEKINESKEMILDQPEKILSKIKEEISGDLYKDYFKEYMKEIQLELATELAYEKVEFLKKDNNISNLISQKKIDPTINAMHDFIIFSPENATLRGYGTESQIQPLGFKGEGLVKLLTTMKENEPDSYNKVIECASIFGWVGQIKIEEINNVGFIIIFDKYAHIDIDHRSSSEGFLFVLFYATLFCSKLTPAIFAIDNIDISLNPKLCRELIKKLIKLSKEFNKQVFVTTQNAAILDGLDLLDEEQRLYTAFRKDSGHTTLKRIDKTDLPKPIPLPTTPN